MIEVSFRSLNHNPIIVSNARPDVLNQVYSRHRIWLSKKGKNDPTRSFAALHRSSGVGGKREFAAGAVLNGDRKKADLQRAWYPHTTPKCEGQF
jgi:hypothetical protein